MQIKFGLHFLIYSHHNYPVERRIMNWRNIVRTPNFEIYLTFLKECNYIDTNRNVTLSLKNNFLLESHHLWLNSVENFLCNCFAQHLTNFYSLKVACSLLNGLTMLTLDATIEIWNSKSIHIDCANIFRIYVVASYLMVLCFKAIQIYTRFSNKETQTRRDTMSR